MEHRNYLHIPVGMVSRRQNRIAQGRFHAEPPQFFCAEV
jgi:hypothetical protein